MTKVLVIEKDDGDAKLIEEALSSVGLSAVRVDDGNKGLLKARLLKPAMILLAVELDGTSGYMICQKMKRDLGLRRIPLLLMSDDENAEGAFEKHASLPRHAEEYLKKPFSPRELLEHIANHIEIELPAEAPEPAPAPEPAGGPVIEEISMDDDPAIEEIEIGTTSELLELDVVDEIQIEELPSGALNLDAIAGSDSMIEDISVEGGSEITQLEVEDEDDELEFGEVEIAHDSDEADEEDTAQTPAEPSPSVDADVAAQLAERDAEIATLRARLEAAQAEDAGGGGGDQDAVIQELREERDTLKDIELTQQETIDRLSEQREELQAQVERLGQLVGGAGEGEDPRIDALQEKVAILETQLAESRDRVTFLEVYLEKLLGGLESARGALNAVLEPDDDAG